MAKSRGAPYWRPFNICNSHEPCVLFQVLLELEFKSFGVSIGFENDDVDA